MSSERPLFPLLQTLIRVNKHLVMVKGPYAAKYIIPEHLIGHVSQPIAHAP